MAFVPAAPCGFEGYSGPWTDCSLERAILVDRYEVTRDDWARHRPEEAAAAAEVDWSSEAAEFSEDRRDWPAMLSRHQAESLAEARGMRLLTAREWIHVAVGAVGRRTHAYPWGRTPQRSYANTLELGLQRPTPVGTFESGRSRPFGCYDLCGNVWEWVSDWVAGYDFEELEEGLGADPASLDMDPAQIGAALGGGYNDARRETFGEHPRSRGLLVFHAVGLDPGHRSPDIGARMGADAATYLWDMRGRWGSGEDVRRRLVSLGRRWAEDSGAPGVVAVLEDLARREAGEAPGPGEGPGERPGEAPGEGSPAEDARPLAWLLEGARSAP